MWDWLLEPFASGFMRTALGAAVVVGVLCPVVGVWVVLRRLAYLGDAMSHASLSGVAVAHVLGASLMVGALAGGVVMGGLVALVGRRRAVADDTAIGVVETVLFATGVLVLASSKRGGVELSHLLLGQITTTSPAELRLNLLLALLAIGAIALMHRDLLAATFDPLHAGQVAVPVGRLRLMMLVLVSISVVVSLQTVGLLMSVALLVTPAATARLLTQRVGSMTAVAVAVGLGSTVGGLTLSYHLAWPPGATIALAAAAAFLVAFGATAVPRPINRLIRSHP